MRMQSGVCACRFFQPVAATLALLTIVVSLTVTCRLSGSASGVVRIADLRQYGGTTFEDIGNLELWRLASAQLIHVKLPHMLLNALGLLLMGSMVEGRIGGKRTFMIWLLAGGIATLVSPIGVEPPWNIGTGASQATFAFAGCAIVFVTLSNTQRALMGVLILFIIIPGISLDLFHAGYPKPGHVAGFMSGAAFGVFFRSLLHKKSRPATPP